MKTATISTSQDYQSQPVARRKPVKSEDPYAGLTGKALMAKQYIDSVGLTAEVFEENMRRIKSQPPPPPSPPPSQEEIITDYENCIFELIAEGEALDCTIRQLQTNLAEKEKLIADLQEKLKLAEQNCSQ